MEYALEATGNQVDMKQMGSVAIGAIQKVGEDATQEDGAIYQAKEAVDKVNKALNLTS